VWRKGQRYGTILCDLERHRVIDLLPDRSCATIKDWLADHAGISIISRDRANAYAEAAREAAPSAVQVADRWHLLRDLTEALQHILESKHALLRQAAKAVAQPNRGPEMMIKTVSESPRPPTRAERLRESNRGRRLARYEAVMKLVQQGVSQLEISRRLGIDRRTVRRWNRTGQFPERVRVQHGSSVDPFAEYLERRYAEGCHNARRLWRKICEQGFCGSDGIVRQWVHKLRRKPNRVCATRFSLPAQAKITGSPRQTAWFLLQQPTEAKNYLEELARLCPEIAACAAVAREFVRMIQERDPHAWGVWLQKAKGTALARFAESLLRDEAAVLNSLQLPWSNGQVEGHVHRLKLIKRQMYGRAKFDLLRLRVVHVA
jgi:transposase